MKKIYISHPLVEDGSPECGDQARNSEKPSPRPLSGPPPAADGRHFLAEIENRWREMARQMPQGPGLPRGPVVIVLDDDQYDRYRCIRQSMVRVRVADESGKPRIPEATAIDFGDGCTIVSRCAVLDIKAAVPALTIRGAVAESHATARSKGWWGDEAAADPEAPVGARNVGEVLMLAVSELAEALEEWRDGHGLTEVYAGAGGKPEGFPIELADVLIRVFDNCAAWGIDIESALRAKMAYNLERSYRHGGKKA